MELSDVTPSGVAQPDQPAPGEMLSANEQKPPKKKTPKKHLRWQVILGLTATAIIIAAAMAIAYLISSGRLYVGFKSSSETVFLQTEVCGNGIIENYNEIYLQYGSGAPGAFDETTNKFKANKDWEKDPVCLYIATQASLSNGDFAGALALLDKYTTFVTNDQNGTRLANMKGLYSIGMMEAYIAMAEASANATIETESEAALPVVEVQ